MGLQPEYVGLQAARGGEGRRGAARGGEGRRGAAWPGASRGYLAPVRGAQQPRPPRLERLVGRCGARGGPEAGSRLCGNTAGVCPARTAQAAQAADWPSLAIGPGAAWGTIWS
jgi:hypothetical protein